MVLQKLKGLLLEGSHIYEMGIGVKTYDYVKTFPGKGIEIGLDEGKKFFVPVFFLCNGNHLLGCIHAENAALAKKGELLADDTGAAP